MGDFFGTGFPVFFGQNKASPRSVQNGHGTIILQLQEASYELVPSFTALLSLVAPQQMGHGFAAQFPWLSSVIPSGENLASTLAESVSPLLQSPRKRRLQEVSHSNCEVVLHAVARLRADVVLLSGDACALHAHVLRIPADPRWLNMMNKRTKQEDNVLVLDVFLGDATVVIIFQFWRGAAMQFGSVFSRLSATSERSVSPLARIERIVLNIENRKCLSPIRKLEASDKVPVQPVNVSMHTLAPSVPCGFYRALLVSELCRLHDALPFMANILGHTRECEDV